jgi:hypothetical protein
MFISLDTTHPFSQRLPPAGERQAATAAKLALAATDNSSCLYKGLKQAFAPVRGVFTLTDLDEQLLDATSPEELEAARAEAAARAAAGGFPAQWQASMRRLAAVADELATVGSGVRPMLDNEGASSRLVQPDGGSAAGVSKHSLVLQAAEGAAAVSDVSSKDVRLQSRRSLAGPEGAAGATPVAPKGMATRCHELVAWVRGHPLTGLLGVLLGGNLVVVATVSALWHRRRRRQALPSRS